jgi:hypothetical protein
MPSLLSELFPLVYGLCFVLLLWQAFRVMSQGFRAVPRPGDNSPSDNRYDNRRVDNRRVDNRGVDNRRVDNRRLDSRRAGGDRTGRLTVHPELLDQDGQITEEDLLTVRFGGDNEQSPLQSDRG